MKSELFLIVICYITLILARSKGDYVPQQNHSLQYDVVPLDSKTHPCNRKCQYGSSPMICHYKFEIENYYTMSKACYDCPRIKSDCFRNDCVTGDGHERNVVTVNRQMPGPAIEVCRNDIIIVDVENHLMAEATTIHWHGQHQKDTPYMDGVPYVTQCPILPKNTFRYTFKAAQAGTHLWHSHVGMQRVDGCFGPIIVRVPEEDNPHDALYDFDLSSHVINIIDWEKVSGTEKFLYHHQSVGDNKAATLLINGQGRFREFVGEEGTYYTPLARFEVDQGYRYRFRLINAGFLNCPIEISIDNHTIQVISTDGNDIKPIEADSLVSYAGERFDFIVSADQPKNLYWIRFRGLMDCDERFFKAHQMAVLEYKDFSSDEDVPSTPSLLNVSDLTNDVTRESNSRDDASHSKRSVVIDSDPVVPELRAFEVELLPAGNPDYDNSVRVGTQVNSLNKGTESNSSHIAIPKLSSLEKWDHTLKTKPDVQIFLAYDFYRLDNNQFHREGYEFFNVSSIENQLLTPQINHLSMQIPSFPLLSQRNEIPDDLFCNENTMKEMNCKKEQCECAHAYEIPLKSVVELVIIDEGFAFDANHPLHLHGYNFRVVAMEKIGPNVTVEQVKQRNRKGLIKRNLLDAPIKDTVTVPDGGYTIVRFQANNPGFWLFHCHIEFHAEIGMALVLKVGRDEEMPKIPDGFPKCGNYMPKEAQAIIDEPKPMCSKSPLVYQFEKLLFGNYCQNASGSRKMVPMCMFVAFLVILARTFN